MTEKKELSKLPAKVANISVPTLPPEENAEIVPLFARSIEGVRDEVVDSPYLKEALRVLPVGG